MSILLITAKIESESFYFPTEIEKEIEEIDSGFLASMDYNDEGFSYLTVYAKHEIATKLTDIYRKHKVEHNVFFL